MITYNLPLIQLCILIPCYNNLNGLINSIKSINYDIEKYIILIIDDGSSEAITHDSIIQNILTSVNIEIVRSEENIGITQALNKGLQHIYSTYNVNFIARLDCGDLCTSDRFYKQTQFLQTNQEIHLIGSWCYFKNPQSGETFKYITPTIHKFIKRSMNFRNVFIHPTVMWRVTAFKKLMYPEIYPYAEDYGLFYEMITKVKSAIINQFLVTCELNFKGISISKRSIQLRSRLKVIAYFGRNNFLIYLGIVKILLLILFPYQFILHIKRKLYHA